MSASKTWMCSAGNVDGKHVLGGGLSGEPDHQRGLSRCGKATMDQGFGAQRFDQIDLEGTRLRGRSEHAPV